MPDEYRKGSADSKLISFVIVLMIIAALAIIVISTGIRNDDGSEEEESGPWKDLTIMKTTLNGDTYLSYDEIDGPGNLDGVQSPEKSVYMLIGIQENLNSTEVVSIGKYLDRGGHVIIADDGTRSERISNYTFGRTGGKVNMLGHRYLVDKKFTDPDTADGGYDYNLSFIKAQSMKIEGEDYLTLVHAPKGMNYTGPGTELLTTTKMLTVVDTNDNWQMDLEDIYMQYGTIGVRFEAGDNGGSITFISSTGLFTDNVFDRYQNGDFLLTYLGSMLPDGGKVLLDQSKQITSYSPHTEVIPV
ncbi:MAG: hypothetical protein R6V01_10635 [Thermoplasmatota archaeon]